MKINWTIRNKLYAGFGGMIILIVLFSLFMIKELADIRSKVRDYKVISDGMRMVNQIQLNIEDFRQYAIDASTNRDRNMLEEKARVTYDEAVQCADRCAVLLKNDPEFAKKNETIKEDLPELWKTGMKMFNAYMSDWNRGSVVMKEFDKACRETAAELKSFAESEEKMIEDAEQKAIGMINAVVKVTIVAAILIISAGLFVAFFLVRQITRPLAVVMDVAGKIAEGNLSQQEIEIKQDDEIGQLSVIFNQMIRGLNHIVQRAEMIANGFISADDVEKKIASGMDLNSAAAIVSDQKGDLADAFNRMQAELCKAIVQAKIIANDDLNNPVLNSRLVGELGESFSLMSANLRNLSKTAEKIASGDLTVKVESASGKSVLANAFSGMINNLKNMIQQMNETADNMTKSSHGLAQVSEHASNNTTQLTSVTNQIAQSTASIAQNAQSASSSSQHVMETSVKGRELAEKLMTKMQSIQSSVAKSEDAIEGLGKRSVKIGEIVSVITKIAEQTNLLSLNAAIEAARAGESGRGFAVVADEIRKLAEHSSSSAQEISNLIGEVQVETGNAVKVTQDATREVEEGGKFMLETDKGLKAISESVENAVRQIEQIAAAAEELAASTEEASASSEEQTASIEEVSASAQNLNQMALDLKNSVSKFKV